MSAIATQTELQARAANGQAISWHEAFASRHHDLLGAGDEPPLAHAVNAYQDARQALYWALKVSDDEAAYHGVSDRRALQDAAALALAHAARALYRHHFATLSRQLGFTAEQVARVRRWARGTDVELAAAVEKARAQGRCLRCSDLSGGAEPVCDLSPTVVAGL